VTGPRMLVVRHRQSTWNAQRRWAGQADPPLSAAGEQQAHELRDALGGLAFDAIVASDLRRALDTARIVAAAHPAARVVTDPRLRELDAAAWSGCTREEIEAGWPGALDRWRSGELLDLPGAEPWARFEERVQAGLHACADRWSRTLVVAHAGVLRVLATTAGSQHGRPGRSRGMWVARSGGDLVVEGLQRLDERSVGAGHPTPASGPPGPGELSSPAG
jgi:glucosyl-3-phosphoglycerate phosphatase